MNIFKLISTVGFCTIFSRITGFIRSTLLSSLIGATASSDAVVTAIRIANFLRKVVAEGALNTCFIPIFSKILHTEGKKSGEELASSVYSLLFLVSVSITVVAIIFYPIILKCFAPGFEGERLSKGLIYGRICFPFIISSTVIALFSAILNTLGKFGIPALIQVLVNIGSIISLSLAYFFNWDYGLAVSVGFLPTGILQTLVIAAYARKNNFRIRFVFPHITPEIKQISKNMIPSLISAGVWQINLLVDYRFASILSDGAVSYFFYADQIIQLPLATLGIAIGSALIPVFSQNIQSNSFRKFRVNLGKSLTLSLGIGLPATAGIICCAYPIVCFIFGRGKMQFNDITAITTILQIMGIALPSYILNKICLSFYFARSDTKTPLKASAINLLTNVLGLTIMVPQLSYLGIPLSNAIASFASFLFLYIKKPVDVYLLSFAKRTLIRQAIAAVLMTIVMISTLHWLKDFFYWSFIRQFWILCMTITIYTLIYLIFGVLLGFINFGKIYKEFSK